MFENTPQLFVTSRPSRSKEARRPGSLAETRKAMELDWAGRIGVDVQKLQAAMSMTDSTCPFKTQAPTTSGTETDNGKDVTADHHTDEETKEISDDLENDDYGLG